MKLSRVIFISFLTICFASCHHSTTPVLAPGAWDKLSPGFAGYTRGGAVSFTIGDTTYVGAGFNYDKGRLKDFWKFDAINNVWSRKSDFPGSGRSGAVAFSLNGKGYVGTGVDDNITFLSDFYEFDPTTGSGGSWKRITDFPSARIGSLAFTVKNRAFVGGGYNLADQNDFWEYDQINDVWISRGTMAGSRRQNGFVMVIDDIAYIGGGTDNRIYPGDFYKFDVTKLDGNLGAWTALNSLTGKDVNGNAIVQPKPRQLASTFTIDGKGYLVCGDNNGSLGDTWQYDPLYDTWIQYYSFTNNKPISGSSRSEAIGFAVTTPSGTFGYLTTGGNSTSIKYNDFWKFNPKGTEPDNK